MDNQLKSWNSIFSNPSLSEKDKKHVSQSGYFPLQYFFEKVGILQYCYFRKEMKKLVRALIPYSLKLQFKLLQRRFHDYKNSFIYSKTFNESIIGEFKTEIKQDIRKGEFHENKIHNLKIVADKINNLSSV